MTSSDLNPPDLAEAINVKGLTGAAGVRIVAIKPGHAEIALARRDDLLQFLSSSSKWSKESTGSNRSGKPAPPYTIVA